MIKKNLFSIIVALVILYLSLTSSDTFKDVPLINIPNIDKIIHFLMYFGFMSVIIFENRRFLKNSKKIFLIALIPLFYGILMELLQLILTASRSANFYDAVFNSLGILFSILLWLVIKPYIKDTTK